MPYYHVWLATKQRKWLLQGDFGAAARRILIAIAEEKDIRLLEVAAVVDHVHMILECDNRAALSWAMNLLKGISSRRLGTEFPDVKMDAQTLRIWQERFGSKLVAESSLDVTRRYIRTQWDRLESFDRPNPLKA